MGGKRAKLQCKDTRNPKRHAQDESLAKDDDMNASHKQRDVTPPDVDNGVGAESRKDVEDDDDDENDSEEEQPTSLAAKRMEKPGPRGSANPSASGHERKNLFWTEGMDEEFLEVMVEQCIKGRRVSPGGFLRDGWNEMVSQLNKKFCDFGQTVDQNHLKNRWKTIKKQYSMMKELLEQKGFCWDDEEKMIIADLKVWNAYIRAHPEAKSYFRKRLPDYNNLCTIFSNRIANGRYSFNPIDENMNDAVGLGDSPQDVDRLNKTPVEEVQERHGLGFENILPSNNNNEHKAAIPSSSQAQQESVVQRVMGIMETFSRTLQDYANKTSDSTLQEKVVAMLNQMKDSNEIDDDIFLNAIFKLTDDKLAGFFLALDSGMRKPFLIKLTLRD